ncbi:PIN domain-containing protein [Pseudomonas alliivorans]|nr:PIN domain-containing protein [Pseudomonas alliivorans]
MRTSFIGYYPPTPEQYEILWNEALFILDTNVLLNLYRLPSAARDELLGVLELLKDRLWIPHQVGLEFQRGRLTVIANERKSTEDALAAAQNIVSQVKQKVEVLQIDKRGLGIQSKPLLDQLEKSNEKLIEAIKAIHSSQIDISSSDTVRSTLDELLTGRVGPAPQSQPELDELIEKGEERFANKIPPGFADADKEKNPNEATFMFDHIKYQRKFGDLILWNQILNHVKDNEIKTVLFVTADRKDDWWWKEHGKTIGPHPELIREIKRSGGVEHFWMYSSLQFVEQANKYSQAKVSTESVAEIEQIATSESSEEIYPSDFLNHRVNEIEEFKLERSFRNPSRVRSRNLIVSSWLSKRFEDLVPSMSGREDFLQITSTGNHGFVITQALRFDNGSRLELSTKARRAAQSLASGEIQTLTLVSIVRMEHFEGLGFSKAIQKTRRKILFLMERYNITRLYVGIIRGEEYVPFLYEELGGWEAPNDLDEG